MRIWTGATGYCALHVIPCVDDSVCHSLHACLHTCVLCSVHVSLCECAILRLPCHESHADRVHCSDGNGAIGLDEWLSFLRKHKRGAVTNALAEHPEDCTHAEEAGEEALCVLFDRIGM